jgi:hypothetical protein
MSTKRWTIVLALFALEVVGFERAANAWGCEGHQAVGIIATKHLAATNPAALAKAVAILQKSPVGPDVKSICNNAGLPPLAAAANWADDVRGARPSTAPFHFIDVPISTNPPIATADFCKKGCVVDAIDKFSNVLQNQSAKPEERADALRFLVHFVGDSHQPLHTSMNSDRGGNCVPVSFFQEKPTIRVDPKDKDKLTVSPNLHSVWDGKIIRAVFKNHGWTVENYADFLLKKFGPSMGNSALSSPAVWITQGHDLAITAYSKVPISVVQNAVDVDKCTPAIVNPLQAKDFKIDQAYVNAEAAVVERQIARAGFRLAALIEKLMK